MYDLTKVAINNLLIEKKVFEIVSIKPTSMKK
jgi:hypothetical protein